MSHVLYYPTIEFQSIDALKKALLVWDRVCRIVPNAYVPADDAEVIEARAAGRIVDILVDDVEKSKAAEGFLDFYRIRMKHDSLTWPAGLDSDSFTRINTEKIDAKLLPLFEQLAKQIQKEGFLQIPADLAGGYMFFLANAVAKQRSLGLITDSADCWAVGSYFSQEGNFTDYVSNNQADSYLCNLAVEQLLPDHLDHIKIDKLLRFCEDHRVERAAFQEELKKLQDEISKCNNKEHARYIAADLVTKLEKARDSYQKTIRAFSKREVSSVFSVGLPTSMAFLSLPGVVGDPFDAIRLSGALLIGAVAALAARELIPKDNGIPSYLVTLEQLGKAPHFPLHRKFEEFVND